MADYYTQFSSVLPVQTKANVEKAIELFIRLVRDDNPCADGFFVEPFGDAAIWIHAEDFGSPDNAEQFVSQLAKEITLKGKWGFEWANTCSKPRPDSFSGGALVIDLSTGDTVAWTNTSQWLHDNVGE